MLKLAGNNAERLKAILVTANLLEAVVANCDLADRGIDRLLNFGLYIEKRELCLWGCERQYLLEVTS